MVEGDSPEVKDRNRDLEEICLKHENILKKQKKRFLKGVGPEPTPLTVKTEFLKGKAAVQPVAVPTVPNLLTYYQVYLDYVDELTGTEDEVAQRTIERYYLGKEYLKKYLAETNTPDMTIAEVNKAWCRSWMIWLQVAKPGKKGMNKDSAARYLHPLKQMMELAVDQGFFQVSPIGNFSIKRSKDKEVYFLEEPHLKKLWALELSSGEGAAAIWYIKLMCFTGLDYVDAVRYANDREEYERVTTFAGRKIVIHRSKPPFNMCEIPILAEVDYLFCKKVPKPPTLRVINYHMHLIEGLVNFKKSLTSKICRKTAGYVFLLKGHSIEFVSKLLGHSDIRTTQKHYVKFIPSLVDYEMQRVQATQFFQ
ncbi:hypothetical protein GCM10027347_52330 [Larkinella harenae]